MAMKRRIKKIFRRNFIARTIYLLAATVICVGVIMLVIFVVNLLVPYLRVVSYVQTDCKPNLTRYETNCSKKNCPSSGSTTFPCIQIYANFQDEQNKTWNSLLHQNEYNLYDYPMCSVSACARYDWENLKNIKTFEEKYGKDKTADKTYRCWYCPTDPKLLIVAKEHTDTEALHYMLWPSLGVFLGIVTILVLYFIVGCDIWGPRIATVMWEKSLKRMEMEQEIKKRTVQGHDNKSFNEF